MKENFPNLAKEINIQVQEAQSPKQIGSKRTTARHIISKMPKVKDKERILKAAKAESYLQKVSIRLSTDFSKETLQATRNWQEVFKVVKSKNLQPRVLPPASYHLELKGR